jgi:FkbM family methyltransferase
MNLRARLLLQLMSHLPRRETFIYDYCRRYVDEYDGNNDPDISANGELRLLRERLPQAAIVFDVGANVGNWARLALSVNPNILLHCFEPSTPTFNKLIEQGFGPNVTCHKFGLGASRGTAELLIFEDGSPLNSIYRREGLESLEIAPQSKSESIVLRTLDDYCEEKQVEAIDFLKVDVEGHELECLRGASGLLSGNRIALIQFEYGGCNIDARVFLKDIFGFFEKYPRYRFYRILQDSLKPVARYQQQLENFQYQNWAVVRE